MTRVRSILALLLLLLLLCFEKVSYRFEKITPDSTNIVVVPVALGESNHQLHPKDLISMGESICLFHRLAAMEVVEEH